MEAFNKFAAYIQNLDRKQLQKYILIFLSIIAILSGIEIYYINNQKKDLIGEIKQLNILANKAIKIIEDNKRMSKEEQRLKDIFEKEKDFTIQGYFEQFCKEQEITPERGWDVRTESINEKFDEIALTATIKELTTEKLVKIISALDQKEIVYIKELIIRNENNGKISIEITIATKKYKEATVE